MPPAGESLWEWFGELDRARHGNGFGALPITFTEIRAWAELSGVELAEWEVRALRAMDDVALEFLNRKPGDRGATVQDLAQDQIDLQNAIAAQKKRRQERAAQS